MIDWTTLEAAIHAWVVAGSGLDTDHVFWANQDAELPDNAFITIAARALPYGQPWREYADNPGGDPGEELTETVKSMVELSVELQAFDGTATGTGRSAELLHSVRLYAGLSSQITIWGNTGWGPARWDAIQDISAVAGGSTFEPRALTTCYGYAQATLTATTTYIELVEVTNTLVTPNSQFTLDLINETVI